MFQKLLIIITLLVSTGCAGLKKKYSDISFRNLKKPNREWKIVLKALPFHLDEKLILIEKKIYFVAYSSEEQQKIENNIHDLGSEKKYLKKFEKSLLFLGLWDRIENSQVIRYANETQVLVRTMSEKPVSKEQKLIFDYSSFPDSLMLSFFENCSIENTESVNANDVVNFEVMVEKSKLNSHAKYWKPDFFKDHGVNLIKISGVKGQMLSYLIQLETYREFSKCPLPPEVYNQMTQAFNSTNLDFEW